MYKKLLFIISALLSTQVNAQIFDVDTIVKRGAPDKYINFVYIGDGYTAQEQSRFIGHVNTVNNGFFLRVPYSNYKNFFNVFAIKVISAESGIKHPRTAGDCPAESSFPSADPLNYFETAFDEYDVHRLIYPRDGTGLMNVVVDNFPGFDHILMIGNTEQYGGAGGAFAVGTAHSSSLEIMLHEAGHSFAGLSDEYWAGDVYAGENYNMTHQDNATGSFVKWRDWLGISNTGIYQHCCGGISGEWYKPHQDCLMEYLEREFCPVCRQRTIEKIYELVSPIVAYTPVNNVQNATGAMDFKLTELILPVPNTLKITWMLNGNPVAYNTDSIRIDNNMLVNGLNTLLAEVKDTSYMLKAAPAFTHHINSVQWSIRNEPSGIAVHSKNTKAELQLYPNPASTILNVKLKGFDKATDNLTLRVLDIRGISLVEQKVQTQNKELHTQLDLKNIPAGNYVLLIESAGGTQQFKFSKL